MENINQKEIQKILSDFLIFDFPPFNAKSGTFAVVAEKGLYKPFFQGSFHRMIFGLVQSEIQK